MYKINFYLTFLIWLYLLKDAIGSNHAMIIEKVNMYLLVCYFNLNLQINLEPNT